MGQPASILQPTAEELLQQELVQILGDVESRPDGDDPWWAIAARQAKAVVPEPTAQPEPAKPAPAPRRPRPVPADSSGAFLPLVPATLAESGLSASEVEALILKFLLNRGVATGCDIAAQLRLSFGLIGNLLRQAKAERLVVYKAAAPMSDYVYELTELGHDRARRYSRQCTYFGTAPVALRDYVASVHAQSVTLQKPRMADVRSALADMILAPAVFSQLGQAVNSGLGLFLYGAPGNGKTSIAERIIRAFGECVGCPGPSACWAR